MALNFDEFQKVVETAQQADAVKSDLKRALKKAATTLEALQGALADMEIILADEYVSVPKQRKPRQPRAANTGAGQEAGAAPKKPGRPKKTAE